MKIVVRAAMVMLSLMAIVAIYVMVRVGMEVYMAKLTVTLGGIMPKPSILNQIISNLPFWRR